MRIPFFKSKQEREMELRIKVRGVIRALKARVASLDKLRGTFAQQVRQAAALGDEQQKRRYALACAGIDARKNRTQRQLLALEGIQAIKEMVRIDKDFAELGIELGRAMQGYLDPAKLARMEYELERGLAQAEEVEGLMDMMMDSVGDSVMSFGNELAETDAEVIADHILAESDGQVVTTERADQIARELAEIRNEVESKTGNGRK